MEWLMESPIPMPSALVVKNGSKMRSASPGSIPGPESCTWTNTPSVLFADRIRSFRGRWAGSRMASTRVHDEIDQHLLQLNLVAGHAGETGCEVGAQRDTAPGQLRGQQNTYVLNDPVNVQFRSPECALHQQSANPGNDRARPRSIAHNLCHGGA